MQSFYSYCTALVAFCFICISHSAQAQADATPPTGGTLIGLFLDQESGEPLSSTEVAVINASDSSIVAGTLTDDKGAFRINLPYGRYALKVTVFGKVTFSKRVYELSSATALVDIGTFRLSSTDVTLKEVTVEDTRSDIEFQPDRRVYNIADMPTTTGGTAADVLQNIPSVTIDIDGNLELRGSGNVIIWIDGKASGLTGSDRASILQLIPASLIERIEVITNPSSKYDAEGQAGIINIVTKRGKLLGNNGTIQVGAGTREKYNASISLNRRSIRYNLSLSYNYRNDYRFNNGNTVQQNFLPGANSTYFTRNEGNTRGEFHSIRLGYDYYFSPLRTISFISSANLRSNERPENIYYTYQNQLGLTTEEYSRTNFTDTKDENYEASLEYKQTFQNSAKQWSMLGSYSTNQAGDYSQYQNSTFNFDFPYQLNDQNTRFTSVVGQADFTLPVSNYKVEFGAKGSIRINDQRVRANTYDEANSEYYLDTRYTDRFTYTEQVYAVYTQVSGKFNDKLEYSGGLRAEQTYTLGESGSLAENYNRDYLNLFPSAFLKYTPQKGTDITLNYSRRVSRPRINVVNPFTDFSDSLNLRTGNPNILPEYTDAYELGYNRIVKDWTLSGTIFYRYTDQAQSGFRTVDPSTGVATQTFANFASSDNLGLEAIIRRRIGRLNSISLTGNGNYSQVNAGSEFAGSSNSGFNWNARLTAVISVTKMTFIQITGNYIAPIIRPQGTIGGFSGAEFGVRQDFFQRKLSVNLNISDVFNTRQFNLESEGQLFSTSSTRKRESQIANITVSYKFGRQDPQQRRQQGRPGQGQDGAPGGGDPTGGFDF